MSDPEQSHATRGGESAGCPDENELVGFLQGALSVAGRARLESHCAGCERCREALGAAASSLVPTGSSSSAGPVQTLQREIASAVRGLLDDAARTEGHVADPRIGQRIGRFELVAVLGRGQFGVVYRARDTELGRMVAVKVMRAGRSSLRDPAIVEALLRTEAAAAARLQHPSIVTLYDYGVFEGAPYLVLELLEGETLRSRIARDGRIAPREALAIAGDVTRGLVAAHAAGVIHRDIKPGNVFVCSGGRSKILDFGLARLLDTVEHGAATHAAQAGTPRYMAPELFEGHPADACSDVYAVGVTLLDLLAGAPAGAGCAAVAESIDRAPISPRLRRLVRAATAPRREERLQSAGALLAELTAAQRGLTLRARARRAGLAIAGVLGAVAAALALRGALHAPHLARAAVAVLGFNDLSGRAETAWLSTALGEMLDADLSSSPAIRVAPQDQVLRARADLGLTAIQDSDPRALPDVRRYLGVEYVVTGSYLSVASRSGPQVRVDVRLRGRDNALLDSISETGGESDLLDIAARIASRLRVRLAGTAITPDEVRLARAEMPATRDAIRLYADGLSRLRRSDLLGARELLGLAVAAEPGFPLAHAALSRALYRLGEAPQMRDEARLAFERSGGLRREEQLAIEASYRDVIGDWPRARALRQALHDQFPDDLEYGLDLAEALDRHEQRADALAVIAELRRLPPPGRDDPRIDLYELDVHPSPATRRAIAIAAADKASALKARWALARARVRESDAERELGHLERAVAAAEDSLAICESLGDREGMAIALYNGATARLLIGDPLSAGIAAYERALALERELGNREMVAWMLLNIAAEYLERGDPIQAALRLDEVAPIATGEAAERITRWRGLQWLEEGKLDRAAAQLAHARQVFLTTHKGSGFELKLFADVLLAQGRLEEARAQLDQFLAFDQPHESARYVAGSIAMSRLELESGHADRAEAYARDSIATCDHTHDASDLAAAKVALARALIAQWRFPAALTAANDALVLTARSEAMPDWIDAQIARAQAMFGSSPGAADATLAELQIALDRARERGLMGAVFEARLAAATIAAQAQRPDALVELGAVARDAADRGFGLIARKAEAALRTAPGATRTPAPSPPAR